MFVFAILNFEKFPFINHSCDQSQTCVLRTVVVIGIQWLIEMNFSKLADCNQIFWNDFVFHNYHICKISSPIIECIMSAPYELSTILSTLCHLVIMPIYFDAAKYLCMESCSSRCPRCQLIYMCRSHQSVAELLGRSSLCMDKTLTMKTLDTDLDKILLDYWWTGVGDTTP